MSKAITKLPWKTIRTVGFQVRKNLASVKKPDADYTVVDMEVSELEDLLRQHHFRSGWFLSYHYHGEDANLCRAEWYGVEEPDRQLHIRLFDQNNGNTAVYAHMELCPIAHPRKHIKEEHFSADQGNKMFREIADSEGLNYYKVTQGDS